jgi:hypothetical protein
METIEKIDVSKMKADIKTMVEEQRYYKRQRKSDKSLFKEREIHPREAQWKHRANRQKLRLMYAAYGKARGKSFQQIESNHKEEPHPLEQWSISIDSIINRYKIQVPVEQPQE